MTAASRIGIVILNWNDYGSTSRCLDSLSRLPPGRATVYLVDNGSVDGSMDRIEAEYREGGIVFHRNHANLGFSAGCNPGMRRAIEEGCGYVLLLNNDCILPDPASLDHAVALAESDPRCGMVGGKLLQWPDTTRIWSAGGTIGWARERFMGFGEKDRGQYERVAERTFISGAFMLLKTALIERVGLLPDVYFFGHEDREYCVRARQAGFRLLYQPRAVVYHQAGASHRASDAMYLYNDTLSRILFKRRTLSTVSFVVWRAAFAFYLEWLLPLRHRLDSRSFLPGVNLGALREAMRTALRDAAHTDRVTLEVLDRFRNGSRSEYQPATASSASDR